MNLDVDEALTSDSLSKQTIVLTVQFGSDRQIILKYEMMTKISYKIIISLLFTLISLNTQCGQYNTGY